VILAEWQMELAPGLAAGAQKRKIDIKNKDNLV
jgi:hypothetical protein